MEKCIFEILAQLCHYYDYLNLISDMANSAGSDWANLKIWNMSLLNSRAKYACLVAEVKLEEEKTLS